MLRLRKLETFAAIALFALQQLNAGTPTLTASQQLRLADLIPNSELQVQAAAASKTGIFLLCTGQDNPSPKMLHWLVTLSPTGEPRSIKTLGRSLPTIAADDAGNVALVEWQPPDYRRAYFVAPDGTEQSAVAHPILSKVAVANGRFYGLWDHGLLPFSADEKIASEIVLDSQQPLFNQTIAPLTGARVAIVRRSDASLSILDLKSGRLTPFLPIESPEIRIRSQPPTTAHRPQDNRTVSNALKTVASNGDGNILVSPAGHPFAESVVLVVNEQAVVSQTIRFAMPKWDDLRSTANTAGHMQGHILLRTDDNFLWIDQANARLAFYATH